MPLILHTLNRGVDKRKIFLDDQDRYRFVHDLFEFNDGDRVDSRYRFRKFPDIASRKIVSKPRKLLVDILTFCLMTNHYHLLLSPKVKDGVSRFMKKLNMGYAKYFNEKYERSGALFEGRYKSVAVTSEAHFVHLPYYIHCNPLDLFAPEWREREIKDHKKAFAYLENYRWSSFPDYIGKKNFPSVTKREFLMEFFNGPEEYKKSMLGWLKDMDLEKVDEATLE